MTAGTGSLTEQPAWKALKAHYNEVRDLHLRKLFADDPRRGEQMTAEAAGIYLDYSKNRIAAKTLTGCGKSRLIVVSPPLIECGPSVSY